MTTFYLIRHAMHDLVGKRLAGRQPGVHLNETGQREAKELVERLVRVSFGAVYASPRERAQESALPLAATLRQPVLLSEEIDDIEFGSWTGRTFLELESDPQWPIWVNCRSAAQPPGGESIVEVQHRIVREIARLAPLHFGENVALFTHSDVIKSALAHFLAIPLHELERFEIAPASVSIVAVGENWTQVRRVNDTGVLRG